MLVILNKGKFTQDQLNFYFIPFRHSLNLSQDRASPKKRKCISECEIYPVWVKKDAT